MSKFQKKLELFSQEYFGENLNEEVLEESSGINIDISLLINQRIDVLEEALGDIFKKQMEDPTLSMAYEMYKVLEKYPNRNMLDMLDNLVTKHLETFDK